MSNYYTQGQQPGPINFSSWSEAEGQNVVPSQPFNNEDTLQFAPQQQQPQQQQQQQQQQPQPQQQQQQQQQQLPFSDPNATKLFRENFRTARDNAIVINSSSTDSDDSKNSNHEYIKYSIIIIVVLLLIGVGIYTYRHNIDSVNGGVSNSAINNDISGGGANSVNFGSGDLSFGAGLLQDLEFL